MMKNQGKGKVRECKEKGEGVRGKGVWGKGSKINIFTSKIQNS